MWKPSSFGIWSTMITSPMPDLKPASTGSEMKLATKPRRSSEASTSMAPTRIARVAPAIARSAALAVRHRLTEAGCRQNRDRRRRADAQRPRCAQQSVDHHRHEHRVQADLDRQSRDRGERHRLGNDHCSRYQPRDDVRGQPFPGVAAQPRQGGNETADDRYRCSSADCNTVRLALVPVNAQQNLQASDCNWSRLHGCAGSWKTTA